MESSFHRNYGKGGFFMSDGFHSHICATPETGLLRTFSVEKYLHTEKTRS